MPDSNFYAQPPYPSGLHYLLSSSCLPRKRVELASMIITRYGAHCLTARSFLRS